MNTLKPKLIVVAISLSLLLQACNGSEKGKWSDIDKEKFRSEMNEVKELSNFGENKSKWIECYLSKCEANYESYFKANTDEAGCTKLATICTDDILSNGSSLGKWSDIDKNKFREEMGAVEALSAYGDNKSAWIECYLSKCEANYASYYKADGDEKGCEKLATECNSELGY